MRQSSRAESPTHLPTVQELSPVLSRALANLNIQLEDELALYRRQRAGAGRGLRHPGRKSATKSLDLIAVTATGGRTRPSVPPTPELSKSEASKSEASSNAYSAVPLPMPSPGTGVESAMGAEMSSYPSYLPEPLAPVSSELAIAISADSELAKETADLQPTAGAHSDASLVQSQQNPDLDDYLESSEELLRSLAAEEAEVEVERGFMHSLLTPLGAGSMLLLLLSSAMFGYLVMNPSSLSRLASLWHSSPASEPSTVAGRQASPALDNIPQPNLANSEFKDLNLNTLGTLKVGPSTGAAVVAGAAVSPSPASASQGRKSKLNTASARLSTQLGATGNSTQLGATGNSAAAVTVPPARSYSAPTAPVQPVAPAPVVTAPQRSAASSYRSPSTAYSRPAPKRSAPADVPSVAPPAPVPKSQASADSFPYKVVTPYESDRTLQDAKAASPDSYLRQFPDGAKIQMGAYSNSAEAEAQIEKLRQQGISADVYKR